jgi:hypothetical protein
MIFHSTEQPNFEPKQETNKPNPTDSQLNEENRPHPTPRKTKTVSQMDAELREQLEKMSGEGGASGIEYEDGKPNAMKRGVRNNMFRLI